MDERHIANLVDTRTTDAFNQLTSAIRGAGFEVTWEGETNGGFHICVPEGYDEAGDKSVGEVAYRNRVEADAKEFIRAVAANERLVQEVPGSLPLQTLDDFAEVMDYIALNVSHEAVITYSNQSPPPNYAVGESAVDRIDKELVAMYAKDVAQRATELVEGTEENGWMPEWDVIETDDEYECYVYVEENDPDA